MEKSVKILFLLLALSVASITIHLYDVPGAIAETLGTKPSQNGKSTTQSGNLSGTKPVVERDPVSKECEKFMLYAKQGKYEEIKKLIKICDVNMRDKNEETPLMKAAENGHFKIVNLLFYNGAGINAVDKRGETALMKASENGHANVVEQLIDYDAVISATDKKNETALSKATENKHGEVIVLLKKGYAKEVEEEEDEKPFHKGSKDEREKSRSYCSRIVNAHSVEMVEKYIDEGCGIDSVDGKGRTALMRAVEKGDEDIFEFLINRGANVNVRDSKNNDTILMKAVRSGDADIVEELIYRSSLNTVNSDGDTALDIARKKKRRRIIKMLEDAGARGRSLDSDTEKSNNRNRINKHFKSRFNR